MRFLPPGYLSIDQLAIPDFTEQRYSLGMPRAARYRIGALDELRRQLAYAPAETRHRQMNAAEHLVGEIDPQRNYPEEFIVYRITGYRPQQSNPATFVGTALLADLVNFIQQLSDQLDLRPHQRGEAWPLDALARKLNVSQKTLQRYRKRGLVCHYVIFDNNNRRLACFADALKDFRQRNPGLIEDAAAFSRVDSSRDEAMIAEAKTLRQREGLTLNQTARRLAKQHKCSHETIRQRLQKHDREAHESIFEHHGPLTERQRRTIYRGWRRGIALNRLADHFNRSASAMVRVVARMRLEKLRELDLTAIQLPTFKLEDAPTVILAAPAVTSMLDELPPRTDALALIEWVRQQPLQDETAELALIGGYHFLKSRARESIDGSPPRPSLQSLDEIETDLRWATALKCRLLALALPTALRRIEANLSRPLHIQSGSEIRQLLTQATRVISAVIDSLDPSRQQRLPRRTAYELDKTLASADQTSSPLRAGARHEPGTVPLDDLFTRLCPWQKWLDPPAKWKNHLDTLEADQRKSVEIRYGWTGAPPRTITGVGAGLNISRSAASKLLRSAVQILREGAGVESP